MARCVGCILLCLLLPSSPTPTPAPPTPIHLINITADIFVLQYHFKKSGAETLADWVQQLTNYKVSYGAKSLPKTLLWRIAPPSLRNDPKTVFPTLNDNLAAIRTIIQLYQDVQLIPRFVYYPVRGC